MRLAVLETRLLADTDRAAGIQSDQLVRFPNTNQEAQPDHAKRTYELVCDGFLKLASKTAFLNHTTFLSHLEKWRRQDAAKIRRTTTATIGRCRAVLHAAWHLLLRLPRRRPDGNDQAEQHGPRPFCWLNHESHEPYEKEEGRG